jgi:hypothetical protein
LWCTAQVLSRLMSLAALLVSETISGRPQAQPAMGPERPAPNMEERGSERPAPMATAGVAYVVRAARHSELYHHMALGSEASARDADQALGSFALG